MHSIVSLVVRGETLNWARKRASGQAGEWQGELVPDKGELSASRKRWSRLGSRHSGRTAIKLRNMRTASDIIMDKLDDLTSSVEFIKSKMMRDECDQMSKEMKQDEEKWKREEYKGVYANIKKSRQFGEVGCGGGLQYILVPNDVQVIAMWNGKVSNENSNKQNEMLDTMFLLCHSNVDITK